MKFPQVLQKIVMSVCALVFLSFSTSFAKPATVDYRFKVHNNTKEAIKKILVSENGKDFGYFDIGNGIPAGATEEMIWDESTNGESCHQYFKAVFSSGEESEAVKFDFCEPGLVLEFE